MTIKKKRKSLPPRHKRMKRPARLMAAKHWLASFEGKHIVRSYRKHFAVNCLCALKELEMLGVPLDPDYVARLKTTAATENERRQAARAEKSRKAEEELLPWPDSMFAYIAGYTAGGFPYGTTWEELDMETTTEMYEERLEEKMNVREWAKDMDKWPKTWMGVEEDLEYGESLLPYLEEFLQDLVDEGMARRTFVRYRDDAWLLGGSIISSVSLCEEYDAPPLDKLMESVACDGILPDDYHRMSESELKSFERMCRRFEKFLNKKEKKTPPIDDELPF